MFFARPHGPAAAALTALRRHPVFKRAKFDVRGGKGESSCLIIGMGQVHPVLRGRFERFQARRIARVQAWIYRACAAIRSVAGVTSFGQEGLHVERGEGPLRLADALLAPWREAARDAPGVESFLRLTAQRWRRSLRRGDVQMAARESTALNGLALLQALHPEVSVYAIERRGIHGVLGPQLDVLHRKLEHSEESAAFQSARYKNGKRLTREEYAAILKRNALVRTYNKLLLSPERDRGIFRDVVAAAQGKDATAFVLGQGHRPAFLRLAREHLPDSTLFCWVTPPQLWWWRAMTVRIASIVMIIAISGLWIASRG